MGPYPNCHCEQPSGLGTTGQHSQASLAAVEGLGFTGFKVQGYEALKFAKVRGRKR